MSFLMVVFLSGAYPAAAQEVTPSMPALPVPPVVDALSAATLTAAPAAVTPQQESGEELVLQLAINDDQMQDFVEGLQKNGKTYLPLGQISSLLDFAITVDAKSKTASGWFIHDNNQIAVSEASAVVKGQKYALPPDSMIVKDQDLLIESSLLQKWLPLDFSINLQGMTLNIHPREPLPAQEEAERKKKYAKIAQQKNNNDNSPLAKIKKVDADYEGAQWPTVDLTFSPAYDGESREQKADYSILAGGDFGFLTTHLYAAGDLKSQDRLSDARLSLGRDDYEKNLLGPLHASSYLMGDISSASLSQVTTASQGRGFTATNRGLDRPDKFGTTSFTGDSKPGYQVELYRNDVLINFVTIDSSGHYEFQEIPVLFGNNAFRLEFYGPQGQRETKTKNMNTGDSLLRKGDFTYNFSADQEGRSIFGLSNSTPAVATATSTPVIAPITPTPTAPPVASVANDIVPRMVGEVEYGVSSWLTATAGTAHTMIGGDDHNYATAGAHMAFAGLLLGVDNALDTSNMGRSTLGSVTTRLFNTDIQLQQTLAKDFVSEADLSNITNPVTSQTSLGLIHQFDLPILGVSDNGLTVTRKNYLSGRKEEMLTYSFSKSFLGMNLNNNLNADRDNLGLRQVSGILSVRGNYKQNQLGLQADYDLNPIKQVNAVRLTALSPISERFTNLATLTNQLSGEKVLQLEDTLSVDMKRYKLSLTGRADDQKNFYVGVTFNVSISKIPQTSDYIISGRPLVDTGTVAIRPFLDMNYNLLLDQGDKPEPNAVIKVGSQTPQPSGHAGLLVASQLPINIPVKVTMDQDSQKDPYLASATGNYQVVPRAGKVIVVNYPLIQVSQIDGTVHVPAGFSAAGLRVDLVNTEGQVVNSTHTAFDGYYLLEGITPGAYRIRIAIDSLAGKHLKQPDDRTTVVKSSDFYTVDMTLAPV